jgi:hypothetical protein
MVKDYIAPAVALLIAAVAWWRAWRGMRADQIRKEGESKARMDAISAHVKSLQAWVDRHEACTDRHVETLTKVNTSIEKLEKFVDNVNKSLQEVRTMMTNYMIEIARRKGAGD